MQSENVGAMESSKGGEVRRVHVVYFLCRNGKIEQPHLIRVHHLHRNGVHLRDVKRWLSELRGKDMPENFAWSYKRRYKAGYVWQDLMDDDLITPIADNEYVLKGSELHDQPPCEMFSSGDETPKRESDADEEAAEEEEGEGKLEAGAGAPKSPPETLQIEPDDSASPKPPPGLDEESPDAPPPPPPTSGSDASDEPSKQQVAVFKIDLWKQQKEEQKREDGEKKPRQEGVEEEGAEEDSFSSAKSTSRRSGYYSGSGRRASNVFRNLLGCKPLEASGAVQLPIHRRERDKLACRDISGGSWSHRRTFDGGSTHQPNRKSRSMNGAKSSRKGFSAVYKPVGEPDCSQCGKRFKPEKLHSHMKSCRGLRGVRKV